MGCVGMDVCNYLQGSCRVEYVIKMVFGNKVTTPLRTLQNHFTPAWVSVSDFLRRSYALDLCVCVCLLLVVCILTLSTIFVGVGGSHAVK